VQWLKIDRSFMRDVPDDPRAARMVSAIIGIADALEMKTVAEGVEHEAQAEFLRRAGATVMQGFLYSPPVPPERAIAALTPPEPEPRGMDRGWNREARSYQLNAPEPSSARWRVGQHRQPIVGTVSGYP